MKKKIILYCAIILILVIPTIIGTIVWRMFVNKNYNLFEAFVFGWITIVTIAFFLFVTGCIVAVFYHVGLVFFPSG